MTIMLLDQNEIGLFRANPNANSPNNMRLTHPDTPGTPGTDTLNAYTPTGPLEGVMYTGLDGQNDMYRFFKWDSTDHKQIPYEILASASAEELAEALELVLSMHEVHPQVTVTKAGNAFSIVHRGAGTMTHVVANGASSVTART